MKKFLAAVFVLASVAQAQYLVYDYKASIKRIDSLVSDIKYSADVYDVNKIAAVTNWDSYTTAGDSLVGFVVIPECCGCGSCGEGSDTSVPYGDGFAVLTRKGDKTGSVWQLPAIVSAAVFDKGVGTRPASDYLSGGPTSMKSLKQVWMDIEFAFEDAGLTYVHPKCGVVGYGFLGIGSTWGEFEHAGFGKAASTVTTTTGSCNDVSTYTCVMVQTCSGSVVIDAGYAGLCGEPPMWDICSFDSEADPNAGMTIPDAVAHGTWSVKLNTKLTQQFNAGSGDVELLFQKLKGKYWAY